MFIISQTRYIVMKKFEMASCVKTWPDKTAENMLIFYNKDAKKSEGKQGYIATFTQKISKLRKEKSIFTSQSARNSKRECSLRFHCKSCQKDFVFKTLKELCVPGKDVKWTLVDPTESSCKCFLEDVLVNEEVSGLEEFAIEDESQNTSETPSKKQNDDPCESQPAAHSTPIHSSAAKNKDKLLSERQSQKTPLQPLSETKSNQNTPKQLKTPQQALNAPRRLFINDTQEVSQASKYFSQLVEKLPKKQALESIKIGTVYGENMLNFMQNAKKKPGGGSSEKISEKMITSLCHSITLKINSYNNVVKPKDNKQISTETDGASSGSKKEVCAAQQISMETEADGANSGSEKGVCAGQQISIETRTEGANSGSEQELGAALQISIVHEVNESSGSEKGAPVFQTDVTSGKRQLEQERSLDNFYKRQRVLGKGLRQPHEITPPLKY